MEQLSLEELSPGAFIVGAIIAGAFIVGAIIAGAIIAGEQLSPCRAIVVGVNIVGAFVAEQLSRSNCRLHRSNCRRSNYPPEHMSYIQAGWGRRGASARLRVHDENDVRV